MMLKAMAWLRMKPSVAFRFSGHTSTLKRAFSPELLTQVLPICPRPLVWKEADTTVMSAEGA